MVENEEIIRVTDLMYSRLKAFRAEPTNDNLYSLVQAARLVETLAYKPVIIKHRRAIQVYNPLRFTDLPTVPVPGVTAPEQNVVLTEAKGEA